MNNRFPLIKFKFLWIFGTYFLFGLSFPLFSHAVQVEIGNAKINSTDFVALDHSIERKLFNDLAELGILHVQKFENLREHLWFLGNLMYFLDNESIQTHTIMLRGFATKISPFLHPLKRTLRTLVTEETASKIKTTLNRDFLNSRAVLALSFNREELLQNAVLDQQQTPLLQWMADHIGNENYHIRAAHHDPSLPRWLELYPLIGTSNQGKNIVFFVQSNIQSLFYWAQKVWFGTGEINLTVELPLSLIPNGQSNPILVQTKAVSVSLFTPIDFLLNVLHQSHPRLIGNFPSWWVWEPMVNGINGKRSLSEEVRVNPIASARLNQDFQLPSALDVEFRENFFGPVTPSSTLEGEASQVSSSDPIPLQNLTFKEAIKIPHPTPDSSSLPSPSIVGTLLSPSDRFLFIASSDGSCRIWDTEANTFLSTWFHYGSVDADKKEVRLALSPDEHYLLISEEKSVSLWNVISGLQVQKWEKLTAGAAVPVTFSLDGQKIAMGDLNNPNAISIFDRSTQEVQTLSGHSKPVRKIQFFRSGLSGELRLISGSEDSTARLWNPVDLREIHVFEQHSDAIRDLDVSKDGKMLITASADASLILWDLETFETLKRLWHSRPFARVTFAFNARTCLSTTLKKGEAGQSILWNLFDPTLERDGLNTRHREILSLAPVAEALLSQKGTTLYSVNMNSFKVQKPGAYSGEQMDSYTYANGNLISTYDVPVELKVAIEEMSNRKRHRDARQ